MIGTWDERQVTGEKPIPKGHRRHRTYRVAVYNNHGGSRIHSNRPLAYLRDFTARACIHEVFAGSGVEAKRLAIAAHKTCSQADTYCHACPGLGQRITGTVEGDW